MWLKLVLRWSRISNDDPKEIDSSKVNDCTIRNDSSSVSTNRCVAHCCLVSAEIGFVWNEQATFSRERVRKENVLTSRLHSKHLLNRSRARQQYLCTQTALLWRRWIESACLSHSASSLVALTGESWGKTKRWTRSFDDGKNRNIHGIKVLLWCDSKI